MSLRVLFIAVLVSGYGSISFAETPLSKLAGVFVSSEGVRFEVSVRGSSVILRTRAELSRYGLCKTPLTIVSKAARTGFEAAEARFAVRQDQCAIDGPIVLHYNRTLIGDRDIYLVDVVIRSGTGRRHSGQTMRWSLTKIGG